MQTSDEKVRVIVGFVPIPISDKSLGLISEPETGDENISRRHRKRKKKDKKKKKHKKHKRKEGERSDSDDSASDTVYPSDLLKKEKEAQRCCCLFQLSISHPRTLTLSHSHTHAFSARYLPACFVNIHGND